MALATSAGTGLLVTAVTMTPAAMQTMPSAAPMLLMGIFSPFSKPSCLACLIIL
jgi:hypothetical protein